MAFGNIDLNPQLIQAVRDAVDIVGIASDHTRLVKAGRRYQGLCPIHKEKSPSFSVDPVQGLFYCFGCGAGGDAIKLHMLTTGDDFPAAIENLAMRYAIPLPSRTEARFAGGKPERNIEGALQAGAEFFRDQLRKSPFARKYLEETRRIPPELVERFGLGYAPEGFQNILPALRARVPQSDLEAAGLVGRSERSGEPYDRFRHRLMFPIHNAAGRLVGFGGRALGDDKAKYVNTAETDRFHKGFLLYGLHLAKREIRETGRAILCEGYFDVIGTVACGLEGAVAGMGTALTPEQTKLLARYTEEVVVAYDGDNAGESAFRRALPLLLAEGLGVRRARFPGSHDPDSLRLEAGEEAVRAAIVGAEDAVTAELDRLIPAGAARDPRAQAKAASDGRRAAAADSGRHPALQLQPPRRQPAGDPGRDAGPPGGRRRAPTGPPRQGLPGRGGTPGRPVAGAGQQPQPDPQPGGAGARPPAPGRGALPDPAGGGAAAARGLSRHRMQEYLRGLLRSICRSQSSPGLPDAEVQAGGARADSCPASENHARKGGCVRKNRASGVPRQADRPLAAAADQRIARRNQRGAAQGGSCAPRPPRG